MLGALGKAPAGPAPRGGSQLHGPGHAEDIAWSGYVQSS